jgi:peptide-methionine (S)-S-oxide reductase
VISYSDLLEVFWYSHNPTVVSYSDQYKSIIFYHDEEQKRLAEASRDNREMTLGRTILTEIRPAGTFYLAEDYHQKYYLKGLSRVVEDLEKIYPKADDFNNSTAVARLNGFAGGYGNAEELEEELDSFGLSEKGKEAIRKIADRGLSPACPAITPST